MHLMNGILDHFGALHCFRVWLCHSGKSVKTRAAQKAETRPRYFFYITCLCLFFSTMGGLPYWVSFLGDAIILIGMVIRFGSIVQHGRFFSHAVSVVSNQELIQTGFYRRIRNPSYTGGWLIVVK